MATVRAPKQWPLEKRETNNSFESWRRSPVYLLSLDPAFTPFIKPDATWHKFTKESPLTGFEDDGAAVRKCATLDLMLGHIANYCAYVITRSVITKHSTSLDIIWQAIRRHLGFQLSGANFLNFYQIKLEPDERPEDVFQRLGAFVEDNPLTTCQQVGRAQYDHYLSECPYLPDSDRRYLTNARQSQDADRRYLTNARQSQDADRRYLTNVRQSQDADRRYLTNARQSQAFDEDLLLKAGIEVGAHPDEVFDG